MTLQEFHQFLIENSGVTSNALDHILSDSSPKDISPFFFKPYESKIDPLYRASTLVSGPIVLSVIALEFALASVYCALESIVNLIGLDPEAAGISIMQSASAFVAMTLAILAAVISPIVNTIDLIGGGITSITEKCSEDENSLVMD
jgi:hypothetical protein